MRDHVVNFGGHRCALLLEAVLTQRVAGQVQDARSSPLAIVEPLGCTRPGCLRSGTQTPSTIGHCTPGTESGRCGNRTPDNGGEDRDGGLIGPLRRAALSARNVARWTRFFGLKSRRRWQESGFGDGHSAVAGGGVRPGRPLRSGAGIQSWPRHRCDGRSLSGILRPRRRQPVAPRPRPPCRPSWIA
jgi:hypothetical protein